MPVARTCWCPHLMFLSQIYIHTHTQVFPTRYAKFYLSETNLNQTPHRNCKSRNNKSPTKNILPPKTYCFFKGSQCKSAWWSLVQKLSQEPVLKDFRGELRSRHQTTIFFEGWNRWNHNMASIVAIFGFFLVEHEGYKKCGAPVQPKKTAPTLNGFSRGNNQPER